MMRLSSIVKKYITIIISLCLVITVSAILNILAPFLLEDTLNNYGTPIINIIQYFLVLIISFLVSIVYGYLKKKYAIRFKRDESIILCEKVYGMEYKEIIKNEPTNLITRIEEAVGNLYGLITESISQISTGVLSIIVIIVIMFHYSKLLMSLYILYSIMSFIGYKSLNKELLRKSSKLQSVVADNYKNVLSFMTNVDFIKCLPSFKSVSRYLSKFFVSSASENAGVSFYAECVSTILALFLSIMQSGIYISAFYLFSIEQITFAQLGIIVLLNNIYRSSMTIVNEMNISLRDARASLKYINETIIENQETNNGSLSLKNIETIKVKVNRISYDNGDTLLNDGEMYLERGKIIGLVGDSGTGKSTLVKIMLGLIKDVDCDVLYNGRNVSNYDLHSLRRKIMFISQNPAVFPVSIKENLRIAAIDMDDSIFDKKTDDIFSLSGFQKFVRLPDGVETMVLEGGANLSGGDRQKIGVGRAIINHPDFLILDEFSNSIDQENENYLMELIKNKYSEKIVLLITHNDKLLFHCDIVYKINGTVLEKYDLKIEKGR